MSLSADERILILALGVSFGAAHLALDPPAWVWLPAVVASLMSLRPSLLLLALFLFVSVRAHDSLEALQPLPTRPITREWVVLAADPTPLEFGWSGQVEIGASRVRLEVNRLDLAPYAQGDRLLVSGVIVGRRPESGWERSRRLVGDLRVDTIHRFEQASGPVGWATSIRTMVAEGARSLDPGAHALFTGLVFGDDRHQDPLTADDFRAAGLGHLLAVSGQNVLFVFLLVGPLLSRVDSLSRRTLLVVLVLVAFGFLTRFEPSVVRALTMAAIATLASARGSPMGAVRVLPIAAGALVAIDPLLAYSLAFQLSVAATSGLVIASPRLAELLPGPATVAETASATIGAQVAVSPLLLTHFGTISLLAVPANILAAPAAAFVMMWGLTGGALAGVAPSAVAAALHLPTAAAIAWIGFVARAVAGIPVGVFGVTHLSVAALGVLVAVSQGNWLRRVGVVMAVSAVAVPLLFSPALAPGHHRLAAGVELVRSSSGHDVVLLDRSAGAESVLEALRLARVSRIDLLVSRHGDRGAGRLVRVITERYTVVETWAPPLHQVPGARVRPVGGGRLGGLVIDVDSDGVVAVTEPDTPRG